MYGNAERRGALVTLGAGHRPDLSIALCVEHFPVLRLLALCAGAQAVAELLLVLLLVLAA